MERRTAFLAILSTFLGQLAGPQRLQREPGILLVNLNLWSTLKVRYGEREIDIPTKVIWEELTK